MGWGIVACSSSSDSPPPDVPDTGTPDVGNPQNDAGDAGEAGPLCTSNPCVTDISAASLHTCAALADGTVRCWGLNSFGQIGQPIPVDAGDLVRNSKPMSVPGLTGVSGISAGGFLTEFGFTCARLGDGTVRCWGSDRYGELGTSVPIDDAGTPTPNTVNGVSGAVDLAAGAAHGCALLADGGLTCWGSNVGGELGRPVVDASVPYAPPGPFEGLSGPVAKVDTGLAFTCILSPSDGTVSCAGSNDYGGLGDPDAGDWSARPVPIAGVRGATEIVVGLEHACALIGTTGVVVCWGDNSAGQLGRGEDNEHTPKRVELPVDRRAVHIGGGDAATCAVLDDGSLWCWGVNVAGGIGPVDAGPAIYTPRRIEGLPSQKILRVIGGYMHMCALFEGGSMWCWGSDIVGELGRSNEGNDAGDFAFPTPAPVVF